MGMYNLKHSQTDTIPVRKGEDFEHDKVEIFLRRHIQQIPDAPMEVEQFPAGHSNLTYLIRFADWEAVLRRPPVGPIPPKAHDMEREYRILSMIYNAFSLAPEPFVFSNDLSIMETPFYLMERIKGVVIDRSWPEGIDSSAETRRRLSESAVETMVHLHQVDWKEAGLETIGYPNGYLERLVTGWIHRYERLRPEEQPMVKDIIRCLTAKLPESPQPTLIHNDFKLNNLIFSGHDVGRVAGLIDWELATIGDPLSDLAVAVSYWNEAGDADLEQNGFSSISALSGFLTRKEFLQLYAEKSGRDLDGIDYHLTFAYFKLAVLCKQIYHRWQIGASKNPRSERLGRYAELMLERAHATMRNV